MQQKSGLKYMILEKKITAMREELDIKEAQLYAEPQRNRHEYLLFTKYEMLSKNKMNEFGLLRDKSGTTLISPLISNFAKN